MNRLLALLAGAGPFALAIVACIMCSAASAHEIGIVDLSIVERGEGRFSWGWEAATMPQRPGASLVLIWPDECQDNGSNLNCSGGLSGTLAIDGLGREFGVVIVKIRWRNGEQTIHTVTSAEPNLRLYGGPHDERSVGTVAWTYFELGVVHILTGFDHLAFVLSLLFLVGFRKRLFWTISGFTIAHSLTLVSSALGWLTLRSPPVETAIALSIMLVASEALKQRTTLESRWPVLVAFVFGLVHGLGFAGALKEIGLPEAHLPAALLTFNLGVEAGQLGVIGIAFASSLSAGLGPRRFATRQPFLYMIGAAATYWAISRILLLAG